MIYAYVLSSKKYFGKNVLSNCPSLYIYIYTFKHIYYPQFFLLRGRTIMIINVLLGSPVFKQIQSGRYWHTLTVLFTQMLVTIDCNWLQHQDNSFSSCLPAATLIPPWSPISPHEMRTSWWSPSESHDSYLSRSGKQLSSCIYFSIFFSIYSINE